VSATQQITADWRITPAYSRLGSSWTKGREPPVPASTSPIDANAGERRRTYMNTERVQWSKIYDFEDVGARW
jgi:hypothetical protein